jgi:hypothetical protein
VEIVRRLDRCASDDTVGTEQPFGRPRADQERFGHEAAAVTERRRPFCLAARGEPDQFVSLRESRGIPLEIEWLGRVYVKTQKRTIGGWLIYRAS